MAKNQKPERTEVKDLPIAEQEMSNEEMDKVQGGAGLNTSKSQIKNQTPTASAPPPTGLTIDQIGVK